MSIFLEERQPRGIWDEVTHVSHVHTFKFWCHEKIESPFMSAIRRYEDQIQLALPASTYFCLIRLIRFWSSVLVTSLGMLGSACTIRKLGLQGQCLSADQVCSSRADILILPPN